MSERKILVVIPNGVLGGAEQLLKIIAQYYIAQGRQLDILALKASGLDAWDDVTAHPNVSLHALVSTSETKGILKWFSYAFKHRSRRYERVYSSHIHINGVAGILRRLGWLKADYFIGRESTSAFLRFSGIKLRIFQFLYNTGYRYLDLLICQTSLMKDNLLKNVPFLKDKAQVIPNPIDLNQIRIIESKPVDIFCKQPYIVSAGRLIPEKGYDLLIKAFATIKKSYPNLKLLILGEGKERAALQELAANLQIAEDVLMPGKVKNVFPYFRNASVCVVSSRIEGFPNVLLQMMSQNGNVVSTLCAGGIDELPGVITAKVEDIDDLTEAMYKGLNWAPDANRFSEYLKSRDIRYFIEQVNQKLLKND